MRISVQGNSDLMAEAEKLYPNYMEKLCVGDRVLFRDLLVEMGLRVEINGVMYEKDCGPYCNIELPDECEDDDLDYLKYIKY